MTAPSITPLPSPPSRSDDPDNFASKADAFLGALPDFQSEANAQATYLDALAVDVDADAVAAVAAASAAATSATNALAASNYKGDYAAGTTYQIGAMVTYSGSRYVAKTINTGVTPVDGANWYKVPDGDVTLTGTQTLSNKTLIAPKIADASNTNTYNVAGGELAANRTVSLPVLTADDDFVMAAATQTLSGKTLTNPTVTNYVETVNALGAGSAFSPSLANGTVITLSTNANATVTLPASVAGKSYIVIVTYGGAHTLGWAGGSTLKWRNGSAPVPTAVNGKIDIFSFFCDGTNTYGAVLGQNY